MRDWQHHAAASDVFSTTAERAAAGMVEPFSPLKPGAIPLTADDPHLIAARGYDWRQSIIGLPHYYRDAGGIWRDTLGDRKPANH